MKIRVKNQLIVYDPIPAVRAYCEKNLIIDNPDYYKLEKMGKWTGSTPKKLYLYESIAHDIKMPFGCLNDLWKIHPVKDDYIFDISPVRETYQENAVTAAIKGKNGILVMPCGSGKTQCGLEIIARIGGRALWLTHTQDLLNQSKQRAEKVLGQGGYGTITAGKVNIGSTITFATVQTMAKIDLNSLRDTFDVIIVDEAQHCAGTPTRVTQFYKVISNLSARYKIGLTATPKRADGLQCAMFALLGQKLHEVSREEVAHTTCPVQVIKIDTEWMPDYECILMGDGTIDYSKVIDNMIHDDKRFFKVMDVINEIPDAAPTLVLANRVEYLQDMLTNYEKTGVCISGAGQSKKAKAERKAALEKLDNCEIDCIFATYQLAKEGLDVPNLRYVVFATPEQDSTTVIQSVGRVGRKADGKDCGTVIDFVDLFGLYQGYWKKRKGYYKKIGAEVIE